MKLLIVEDDDYKFSQLKNYSEAILKNNVEFISATSVRDAIVALDSVTPNKIILDMSLPSHSPKAGEGSPLSLPNGGIEVLLELASKSLETIPIIILTQYSEIEVEDEYYNISDSHDAIKCNYGICNLTIVHYEHENEKWKSALKNFLER
ncbi:hypothetical protein ACNPK3_00400 [Shewanella algae]|uniref:hypothetical protein n=1 Tax=Shewanella algae TaxID=38313 RepID=UPI0031F5A4B1